ncbi:MAG TPA: alpha/beta fold hydrolase [Candidatus Baltobacteraceae bacterium]|nr:alpha/beta fold hydrolase [Candidatus Baltobacteraceae bacterium]
MLPQARTKLLSTGRRSDLAVVLFHGLTNSPAQYSAFAPMLFERGVNVLVPRMPEHGDRDRMTTRIAGVTPEALVRTANEAVDIACGLGERTGVLGISMGALLAGYCAQFRRLDVAVLIAPNFGLLHLPRFAGRLLSWGLRAFPNRFMWWDPRVGDARRPFAAYPRFPTRVLGGTMSIAEAVYVAARRHAPLTERIVTIVNRNDPAVSNAVTEQVVKNWRHWNPHGVSYTELENLPRHHDIVDPEQPLARTDLVYPRFLEALGV